MFVIVIFFLFCLGICCSHYFKQQDNASKILINFSLRYWVLHSHKCSTYLSEILYVVKAPYISDTAGTLSQSLHQPESLIVGIYFSQPSVIYFLPGIQLLSILSGCPLQQGVGKVRVNCSKVSPKWRLNLGFVAQKNCPFPLNRGVPSTEVTDTKIM